MATEQSTIAEYALDGNIRRFSIPFEYLSRPFVQVTLMGVDRKALVLGSDYRFLTLNEIETTRSWGEADGYRSIELRRVTSATNRLVEFSDGSVLRSRDMNVNAIQTIHIAEEARNLASDTLASDDEGNLDARGRRLVNLGNAVNPKDAMTYEQVTGWSQSALNQANRSQTEANKSAASAAAALASQNAAKTSETATNAARDRSESARDRSESARDRSESARDSAVTAEGVTLGYRNTAAVSASAALSSQNATAASQSAAKTSETNAKTSETNAKTSETNAKTSETNAKTSETNAKTSEIAANAARDRAENAKAAIEDTEITSLANAQSAAISEANAKDSELAALQYRNEAADFTPANHLLKASNLSDIPDKTLAISNLGLDTAIAKKADQTALNATNTEVSKKLDKSLVGMSPNQLMTVGSFGIGNTEPPILPTKSLNDPALPSGFYYALQSQGFPISPDGAVLNTVYSGVWKAQMAFDYRSTKTFRRSLNSGNWTVWGQLYTHLDKASYVDVEIRSDKRDKSNLETLKNPLDSIEKLTGYTYLLDTQDGPKESAGVIAQDVLKVLPAAVGTSTNHNEEERYTVNYNSLTALLIEAVKELSVVVKHLKEVIHNGS